MYNKLHYTINQIKHFYFMNYGRLKMYVSETPAFQLKFFCV